MRMDRTGVGSPPDRIGDACEGWKSTKAHTNNQSRVSRRRHARLGDPKCTTGPINNQVVLEPDDSSQTEPESDTTNACQEDQQPIMPGSPTGWMDHIESLIKEVKEGRSPEGRLAIACKEFTIQHSKTPADPEFRFGPEWADKKQGSKEIHGSRNCGFPAQPQKKDGQSWTGMSTMWRWK